MTIWEDRRSSWVQQPEDKRTPYDVDYARIVHSGSFRRLQGKTQVLNLGDSDFYRTRLTHTLEVAQIANSIVRQLSAYATHPIHKLLPSTSLIQAIAFAHDLGHPPFGHGGEVALNYCMRNDGGFEGNGQTLRILARLESFSEEHGADVTRRTLLGVLKYPASYEVVANPALMPKIETKPQTIRLIDREASKPPKCYLKSEHEVVEWVLSPLQQAERDTFTSVNPITDKKKHPKARFKSFDCSIMDVADDIAYGVHDLEDAIAMGLISERDFRSAIGEIICAPYIDMMKQRKPDESHNNIYEVLVSSLFGTGKQRKHYIGRLVHLFITGVEVVEESELIEHLIRFNVVLNKDKKVLLDALQTLIEENVIKSAEVQHLEFKGQKMVVSVFEALACDPKALLPADTFAAYKDAGDDLRTVCDYVAGMTDGFLLKTYDRLFSPRMGSVFDKI